MLIITGGAGFIGSALIWGLNSRGFDDIIIVDRLQKDDRWKNLINLNFSDYIDKDVFIERIENDNLNLKIDGIIHMGACTNTLERDADFLMKNNFEYTKCLAKWCIKKGARFVYASSASTYGDGSAGFSDDHKRLHLLRPLNIYAYSKHIFDLWALRNGLLDNICGLKYFNVFGPNEYHKGEMRSIVFKAYEQIKKNKSIKLFKSYKNEFEDGRQMRDFIYIKDAVDITLFIYDKRDSNGIINIGTGKAKTFYDLSVNVFNVLGEEINIEYIEMPEELRARYQYFTQADISKLNQIGYHKNVMLFEDAVNEYIKDYILSDDMYLGNED
ncbi:MAG: ADP-glyceromanno-heptose 6-epimerase [bacterium]